MKKYDWKEFFYVSLPAIVLSIIMIFATKNYIAVLSAFLFTESVWLVIFLLFGKDEVEEVEEQDEEQDEKLEKTEKTEKTNI